MNDGNDPQLDTLLREHFASQLDAQLGKSAERFMREVGVAAATGETVPAQVQMRLAGDDDDDVPDQRWRRLAWSLGLAGAAIAASIAIAFVLPALLQGPPSVNGRTHANGVSVRNDAGNPSNVLTVANDGFTDVEHALSWRTVDQGTVYLDELPMRSVVRQANETVRWYDPRSKARVELTVPRDEVTLVGYQSQ